MQDREMLEAAAQEAICPCRHYDLADNLEITTDSELLEIIEGKHPCEDCD